MSFELIFFFIVSIIAVLSAVMMITRTNPVMSVLYLIVNFFCLAILYLTLHAQFIAIIQILVYAGAIMVLFLFVIMLLNLGEDIMVAENKSLRSVVAVAIVAAALLEVLAGFYFYPHPILTTAGASGSFRIGTVEAIGKVLYRDFLLPFEATSMLLLAAMIGVIILAKKKSD